MTTLSISNSVDVEALLIESERISFENPQAMLEIVNQAMEIAQEHGDYSRFALALAHQAWAHGRLNRHEPSLLCVSEALVMARRHNLPSVEIRAISIIAFIFRMCGLKEEATRLYKQAMELAENHNDPARLGTAINNYTMSRYDQGDTEGLVDELKKAVALIAPDHYAGLYNAIILTNIANLLADEGKYEEAIEYAYQALDIAGAANCVRQVIATTHVMSYIYFRAKNFELAEDWLNRAYRLISDDMLDLNLVNGLLLRGRIYAAQGRDEEAVSAWETAYRLAIQGNMMHFAIQGLEQIRDFYENRGDLTHVIEAYSRLHGDVQRHQRQHADLRLAMVALVFAQNTGGLTQQVKLSEQKYQILQRISHEFRTPLTIIQTSAEMIDDYGDKMSLERRQKHLKNISSQVRAMTMLLENITALLEEPTMGVIKDDFIVSLDITAYSTISRLEATGIDAARVNVEKTPSGCIAIPNNIIVTIAYHLLNNALRYSTGQVDFQLFVLGGSLMMRISDNGIGIPDNEQRAVFKPLVRGSNQTNPTGGGLGLSVVAKLVAQMRGTIDLISSVGYGTTATVRIPL